MKSSEGGVFWRQKSKVVMDDTMNFNECLQFLEQCELMDKDLHSKTATMAWATVSSRPSSWP